MAQQTPPHHGRPFMSKQTFDQVSLTVYGQSSLDYHTNYIIPRANWNDSDIFNEAQYYAGLVHGPHLSASQNPDGPMTHEDSHQISAGLGNEGSNRQPGTSKPLHPSSGQEREQELSASILSLPMNDLRLQTPYGSENRYIPPWARHNPGLSHSTHKNTPSLSKPNSPAEPTRSASTQQHANPDEAKSRGQKTADPIRVPPTPDGKTRSIAYDDNSIVIHRSCGSIGMTAAGIWEPRRMPQTQIPARRKNNILAPLIENLPGEIIEEDDEDLFESTVLEESDEEMDFVGGDDVVILDERDVEVDFDEIIDEWFDKEADKDW